MTTIIKNNTKHLQIDEVEEWKTVAIIRNTIKYLKKIQNHCCTLKCQKYAFKYYWSTGVVNEAYVLINPPQL